MADIKTVLSNVTIQLPYEVALSAHAHLRMNDWLINDDGVAGQYKRALILNWGEELYPLIIEAVRRLEEEPEPVDQEGKDG